MHIYNVLHSCYNSRGSFTGCIINRRWYNDDL
jgi:hypothetical protein